MRAQAKSSAAADRDGSVPRGSRNATRLTICLLVAALALLALAPTASASVTARYPAIASFGPDGTSATSFGTGGENDIYNLAFDQAADRLYVLDKSGPRIHAFSLPSLTPAGGAFPLTVPAPNCCGTPIAVDNSGTASQGRLYYVAGDNKIYAYDSAGAPVGGAFPLTVAGVTGLQIGAAVDPSGNLFVSNLQGGVIRKFSPAGALLATIPAVQGGAGPRSIAIASNGDLFVDQSNVGLYRYTAPSYTTATPIPGPSGAMLLAIDRTANRLYVAQGFKVSVFDSLTNAPLYEFAHSTPGESLRTVAVDESTDTLYAGDRASSSAGEARRIFAFGPAQSFADATATPNPATAITDTSAQVSATITENSPLDTAWRLEVSGDGGANWRTVGSGRTSGRAATIASTGADTGTLTVRAAGGAFKLTFAARTTAPINYNASASALRSALEALSTVGAGNVTVSGGPGSPSGATPYNLAFTGALAGTAVTQISTDVAALLNPDSTVIATATGLDPNSDYRFRAVTNKGPTASTEVTSFSLTFHTVAPPPVITDVGAVEVADTSARLVATIDPRNTPTGYVFQYGTTPALGQQTAPVNIGSGITPITVSQLVSGLAKDTTYYFRAVATNLTGTTASPSHTLHTRAEPLPLPEDRGWEMVTPPDKNVGSVENAGPANGRSGIAPDGQTVASCFSSIFSDPASQMKHYCAPYLSKRSAGGWVTTNPFPRYCGQNLDEGTFDYGAKAILSYDFTRAALSISEAAACPIPSLDPAAPSSAFNLYRQDFADPFAFKLLAPRATVGPLVFAGGSESFSNVVYLSDFNQTDPPDSPPPGNFSKLYNWSEQGRDGCAAPAGCLSLLSVRPDGTPFTTPSTTVQNLAYGGKTRNTVSISGEKVYFQSGTTGDKNGCTSSDCQLYLRENPGRPPSPIAAGECVNVALACTFDVSASECTVDCGPSAADIFQWATPSGEVAFLASCAKLTDASAAGVSCNGNNASPGLSSTTDFKLYRWDRNAAPGNRLVDLTVDNEPADGSQPNLEGFIGASEDGDTAFFVANRQIVAGETTAVGAKIYRWRLNGGNPTVDYLGLLAPLEGYNGGTDELNWDGSHRRVSTDGRYLLITTLARLDPVADRDSDLDIYRWGEAEGWTCVSCQRPGVASAGDSRDASFATFWTPGPGGIPESNYGSPRLSIQYSSLISQQPETTISDDGRRIFFETPDALVQQDINGEAGCPPAGSPDYPACMDVYEWHDGTVSLISSGTGEHPSYLIGSSRSGEDVLFGTRQRLVGWDVDNGVDYYDARVGGGFPEPPAQPPACDLDAGACEGPPTVAPSVPGAGSGVLQGPENPPPPRHPCPRGKRRVVRNGRARCIAKKRKRHHRAAKHNRRAGR